MTQTTFEPLTVTYRTGLMLMDTSAALRTIGGHPGASRALAHRPFRRARGQRLGPYLGPVDPQFGRHQPGRNPRCRWPPVQRPEGAHFLSAIEVTSGRLSATWADTIEAAGWPDDEYIDDIRRCSLEVPNGRHVCLVRRNDADPEQVEVTLFVGAEAETAGVGWADLDATDAPSSQASPEETETAAPSKPWWKFWA